MPLTGSRGSTRVLLGVTGGIAAYKAAPLVRAMRAAGLEVRCALTRSASQFVTPLTLEVLTGHAVLREEYLDASDPGSEGGDELHVTTAQWADLLCIAPLTAHTLARLSLGLADDFLTTTALMCDRPWVVAPAMHDTMWRRSTTQEHLRRLRDRGVVVVGPETGPLASGEIGVGRLAEPQTIVAEILRRLRPGRLAGRSVLVTAGPTFEPIDPVRFLGNRSSGKMGFHLAAEAARRGATVTLVAGPCSLETPPGVERTDVGTALEMKAAVDRFAPACDLVIMAAAVADYRPRRIASQKRKKTSGKPDIELEENPDILAGLARLAPRAVRVGFAAETENLLPNATAKLKTKNVDWLIANDVSRADIGFGSEDNEVLVFGRGGPPVGLAKQSKGRLAAELLDLFAETLESGGGIGKPESTGSVVSSVGAEERTH